MQQLTGLDASMLYMDTGETPNHVAAFYTYDPSTVPGGTVSFDAILKNVDRRLDLSRTFRRKLVKVPFGLDHPYWVEDAHFDLEHHVRPVRLPRPGSWRQLCNLVARLHAQPLDLDRPPWEMYVIEGLADGVDGIPRNGFVILLKIHHTAVDGVAGIELLSVLHDREPGAEPPPADRPWRSESPPRSWELLVRAGINSLVKPMHALRVAGRIAPTMVRVPLGLGRGTLQAPPLSMPRTRFNAPVGPRRSIDGIRTSLAEVKRIRSAVPGATVNDAVLTVVGGAMRRYLDSKGELPERSLVALVPISTRTSGESGAGGNRVTMMTATLATEEPDPVKRLALVSIGMRDVKDLAGAVGGRTLADLSDAVPGLLLGLGTRAQSRMAARNRGRILANTAITNVPGPSEPLYFTGARVVGPHGAGPIPHGMGLIHLIGSYAGQFVFSFTADAEMVPDPAFYARCLQKSLDELSAAAPE
jgi:diacylglycerol O-acyltransferase / wax synthase